MASREAKRIDDLVGNIEGTFVETVEEGVQADDPNLENPCKVKYIPDIDVFKHPIKSILMMFGKKPTVTSKRIYPKSAVQEKIWEGDEEGAPKHIVVIYEDQYGNQPYLRKLKEGFDGSIADIEKEKSETEKESLHKDIQRMEEEDENKRDNSEPRSRGGSRSRRDRMEEFF